MPRAQLAKNLKSRRVRGDRASVDSAACLLSRCANGPGIRLVESASESTREENYTWKIWNNFRIFINNRAHYLGKHR